MIPFRNATGDPSLDYLGITPGNQISGTLEYVRDLSVRPFATARRYAGAAQRRKSPVEGGPPPNYPYFLVCVPCSLPRRTGQVRFGFFPIRAAFPIRLVFSRNALARAAKPAW